MNLSASDNYFIDHLEMEHPILIFLVRYEDYIHLYM